jgi:hypothetical protein
VTCGEIHDFVKLGHKIEFPFQRAGGVQKRKIIEPDMQFLFQKNIFHSKIPLNARTKNYLSKSIFSENSDWLLLLELAENASIFTFYSRE